METSVTQEILDNVRIEMFQPGHQLRTLLIFNKYESIGVALYALKKSRDFPKQPTIPEFVSSPPSYCSRANIQLPCKSRQQHCPYLACRLAAYGTRLDDASTFNLVGSVIWNVAYWQEKKAYNTVFIFYFSSHSAPLSAKLQSNRR